MNTFTDLTHMQLPKISVCVATFNRPKSLTRLLGLLEDQKHTDFRHLEVSIVNDGSHENGYQDSYDDYPFKVLYYPRTRHVRNRPRVYSCTNMAVARSSHEIMMVLGDDVLIDDHTIFIQRLYHMLLADKGVVLRVHNASTRDPDPYQAPFSLRTQDWGERDYCRVYLGSNGMSMRRDIWEDVGGFDEDYDLAMGFADLDLGIQLWEKGYNITEVDGIQVFQSDEETEGSLRTPQNLHLDGVLHRNGELVLRHKWGKEVCMKYGLKFDLTDEAFAKLEEEHYG